MKFVNNLDTQGIEPQRNAEKYSRPATLYWITMSAISLDRFVNPLPIPSKLVVSEVSTSLVMISKVVMKNSRRMLSIPILVLLCTITTFAANSPKPLPSLREQAAIQQQWLKLRLERVLPSLMRKHGVAMWLVICREYNEDPVFYSLVSPTVFAARRRTIYVFFDRGEERGVERLALGGGSNGGLYTVYRDPEVEG
ncbi:MAG TPA: hypothetical protein VLG74_13455, partial [Blastocatellia bacterium]|nr:hypothetical protein [Blastocatellia bacterium]